MKKLFNGLTSSRKSYSSFVIIGLTINGLVPTYAVKPTIQALIDCNYCNCNYILFTKLAWPGDSEGTFRSSSQAATCPPVYHTRRRLHTVPLIAERQAGKL